MTAVSIVGLGAMGSAIANAFMNAGHSIAVWNRNPERLLPFRTTGAACVDDIADCIASSPVTVICIDDYAACHTLLRNLSCEAALRDRTLIQFSTGKPQEARDLETCMTANGTAYLDGAILAYPREIGHDGLVFLSGKRTVYKQSQVLLAALTTDLRYLGESIGAAAGLDIAILFYYISAHLGLTQAALICESEGVRADLLASVIADSSPSDIAEVRHLGDAIQSNEFSNPGASLGVYNAILDRVLSQARDARINDDIPRFANRMLKRGMLAGLADQEIVSLIKLLRSKADN
jgi:3-hydroxyisobutyrate dehydrogenase-like beta-hydroxyacid dehydrogenase